MNEYDNIVRGTFGRGSPGVREAVVGAEIDPTQAERAYQLERATGVPMDAILPDLNGFEKQTKANMASDIVANNPQMSDWLARNPPAAKLANDDYGTLDGLGQTLGNLPRKAGSFLANVVSATLAGDSDARKGFMEGLGEGGIGSWISPDDWVKYPLTSSVASTVAAPVEILFRGLNALTFAASYDLLGEEKGHKFAQVLSDPGLAATLQGLGPPGVVAASLIGGMQRFGGGLKFIENRRNPMPGQLPEYDAYRVQENAKDLENLRQAVTEAQASTTRQRVPGMFADYAGGFTDAEIGVMPEMIMQLYGEGKLPAVGDGLLGFVPDLAPKLVAALETGDDVRIPVKDWITHVDPAVNDALLPGLRMRPDGITAVEAAQLQELQAVKPPSLPGTPPPLPPEVLPAFREATGLEPMFSIGDRKLALDRVTKPPKTPESLAWENGLDWYNDTTEADRLRFTREAALHNERMAQFGPEAGFHDFNILDENDIPVGYINISTQDGGKTLYVDMISGVRGLGPRDFGPSLMRSLLKQLKAEFPDAERITGHRVTGMRSKFETWDRDSAQPSVKLDAQDGPALNSFRELLEGGQWETYSEAIKGYVVPDALRGEQTSKIAHAVRQELERLVPQKVRIGIADTVKATDTIPGQASTDIRIGGAYLRYRDMLPMIVAALDSDNVMTSARHEAIHHLRQYGFFTKEEWSALEAEALAGGWFKKHRIDERYPNASAALKLEEAIAEEFPAWMERQRKLEERGAEVRLPDSPLDAVFRRLKEFFDSIRDKVSQLLGREATWEDVFKKVDTGEIGSREGVKPLDSRAFDPKLSVEPPKEQGKIRFYHGTAYEKIDDFTGKTFVTTSHDYARDYHGGPNNVFYVDLTKDEAIARGLWDEVNDKPWSTGSIDDGASVLKPIAEQKPAMVEPKILDEIFGGGSRVFERAAALGMSVERYSLYDKALQAQHKADIEAAEARALRQERIRQTQEWKAARKEERARVAEEINLRPDIAADNFFADGVLYGESVEKVKLATDALTEEQRAALPRDYYRKDGMKPDDLAPVFGFPDGESLIRHLSALTSARRQSNMRPIDFKRRMIDIETDRRMEIRFGILEDNIVDAAKEVAASETQLDILHEQTHKIGMEVGAAPLTKEQIRERVSEAFDETKVGEVSSDAAARTVGRAGKAVELALLKQDPATAFKAAQQQEYAQIRMKLALDFEKEQEKFTKLAKQLSKREVKAVDGEFLDFIQEALNNAGIPTKRPPDEIARAKEIRGTNSLAEFIASKRADYPDLDAPDWMLRGEAKALDEMTVAEFQDFHATIKALNHAGRDVRRIIIEGEAQEFAEFKNKVLENITSLPPRSRESLKDGGKWIYKLDASLTRIEEIVKDLDLRKELGPLWNALFPMATESKQLWNDMTKELAKHFEETKAALGPKWIKSLTDTIPQDLFWDPRLKEPTPFDMTRENLLQVMLNWGTKSNIEKLVQGAAKARFGRKLKSEEFGIYRDAIKALIDKHATAEDWQFVQALWAPFKKWQPMMDTLALNTTGNLPKLIPSQAVETPHGIFEGGYWPVHYDKLGSGVDAMISKQQGEGLFGPQYFRPATAKGYLKERTRHVDFVDISNSIGQAVGTMQQTMRDLAFRDFLIQANKIFSDRDILNAIKNYYGVEYADQLMPWLKRVANQYSMDSKAMQAANDFLRRTRTNLIGHSLPFNMSVIMSPSPGKLTLHSPADWASYISAHKENFELAKEKSHEIKHMVYSLDRDYHARVERLTQRRSLSDIQRKFVEWAFEKTTYLDRETRVATFVTEYKRHLAEGKNEAEASHLADSAVRERHGAASDVDSPAFMNDSEAMKSYSLFMGYFNMIYNWQRQIPGQVRRGEYRNAINTAFNTVLVGAAFNAALFTKMKEDDSWLKVIAKSLVLQPLSTIPVLGPAANFVLEGNSPRMPFSSALSAVYAVATDSRKTFAGELTKKPVQHVANAVGLTTGLPLNQAGKTGQFLYDLGRGQQRPRNIWEYIRGLRTGSIKLQ